MHFNTVGKFNPYEQLLSLSPLERLNASVIANLQREEDSRKSNEKEESKIKSNTEVTSEHSDMHKEEIKLASTTHKKALGNLQDRLQSAQSELEKLDQQIKSFSIGGQNTRAIRATLIAQGNQSLGIAGAGIAAGIADIARSEVDEANGKPSDKIAIKGAMMKYLSAQRSVKIAEIAKIQQEIAQAQGL